MKIQPSLLFALAFSLSATLVAEELKPAAWVPLPAIGSSPETGFQYGAYVMRIFPQTKKHIPQNRLELLLQGTTQGQYQAYVWPNFYVADGQLQVKGKLGGKYWPSDYFGQGNETGPEGDKYANSAFEGSLTLNKKVTSTIKAGASIFAEFLTIEDIVETPQTYLLNESVSGYQGGYYSGIGLNTSWDTRDNLDWPTEGFLLGAKTDLFSQWLGSDLNFQTAQINAAHYWAIADDVIAISSQLNLASENTPFTHLPKPTGDGTLRGANGNRWIDQTAVGVQSEYRMTLTPKWAVVMFADSFQVAAKLNQMSLQNFHISTGAGIRFGMTPDRFNIRLDVGWVDMDAVNFAITVGEAF